MNILQLGLDIDTFDETKKRTLQEFITYFDTLSKYDGKVFNPVMGGGLIEFNKSIAETSSLLDELNIKVKNIGSGSSSGSAAKQQTELSLAVNEYKKNADAAAIASAKLAVTTSNQAKETAALKVQLQEVSRQMLEEARNSNVLVQSRVAAKEAVAALRAEEKRIAIEQREEEKQRIAALKAQSVIEEEAAAERLRLQKLQAEGARIFSQNNDAASSSVSNLGKQLTSGLSTLRTLAYILPGIGIAGIFNLAFEAISAATSALLSYENGTEELIAKETKLNEVLISLSKNLQDVNSSYKNVFEVVNDDIINTQKLLELDKARGLNQKSILETEVQINEARFKRASQQTVSNPAEQIRQIKEAEKALGDINGQLANVSLIVAKNAGGAKLSYVDPQTKSLIQDPEEIEKKQKSLQEQFNYQKELLTKLTTDYQTYYNTIQDLDKSKNELLKFNADQERKFRFETAKQDIAAQIDKNQQILKNDRSTQNERIAAITNIHNLENQLNKATLTNVLSNPVTNPLEAQTARNANLDANKSATVKANEEIDRVNTDFYQRHIKALTETNKAEIDQDAISNEKIFRNEQKSFEERLLAYNEYVKSKQTIQNLEYLKDIQAGANKQGGKTSLTSEELEQLRVQSNTQQANIQADAEKQVYDIVYTSVQKQLKLIVDSNKLYEESNKQAYAIELSDLNKSFEDKKIKYEDYRKARLILDNKYRLAEYTAAIQDDELEVKRLSDFVEEQKSLRSKAYEEMNTAKDKLDNANSVGDKNLGYKQDYDEALGKYNAYNVSVLNSDKELKKAQNQLEDDELKRAKAKYDQLQQMEKEHAANRKAIEEELYNLVKTYVDGQSQHRIEALEKEKQVVDENYDSQIAAVDKSSLSLKDKQALDIQLVEQKKEYDKNTQREENKLKHDQAVLDRELTLAHIAWETEQAVMAAYSLSFLDPISATGLAIERGILGAIAAATVLATPIPSYATGTLNHPGGVARYGEDGMELVKEPYKSPYLVLTETISYLPKGTEVIPVKDSIQLSEVDKSDGWEQTRWLAKQIKRSRQEIKNNIHNTVTVDMSTVLWSKKILGN